MLTLRILLQFLEIINAMQKRDNISYRYCKLFSMMYNNFNIDAKLL